MKEFLITKFLSLVILSLMLVNIYMKGKKTVIPHALKNIILSDKIILLVTIHRRENILVMSDMYKAIKSVPCTKCLFIVPVHSNPQAGIHAKNICKQSPNKFICVPPLSFQNIHWVMNKSQVLLTD